LEYINPAYFKSKGIHIYSIQQDLNGNFYKFAFIKVLINDILLLQEYSHENALRKTRVLHDTIAATFYLEIMNNDQKRKYFLNECFIFSK